MVYEEVCFSIEQGKNVVTRERKHGGGKMNGSYSTLQKNSMAAESLLLANTMSHLPPDARLRLAIDHKLYWKRDCNMMNESLGNLVSDHLSYCWKLF